MAELFSTLLQRSVLFRIREDNEACPKVFTPGYSKKLRHLKRVHKINLASVKEQLDRDDTELMLVGTKYQKADIFTKALSGTLWLAALSMLCVHDKYEIMKSSSAGLKMTQEMTLSQPVAEPTVTLPGYKKKQKRKPPRVKSIPSQWRTVELRSSSTRACGSLNCDV